MSGPKDSSGVPEDIQNLLKESISCHRTAAENISNEVVLSYGQGLDTVSKPTGQAKLKAAYTRIAAKEESMILAEQAHAKRGKEVAHVRFLAMFKNIEANLAELYLRMPNHFWHLWGDASMLRCPLGHLLQGPKKIPVHQQHFRCDGGCGLSIWECGRVSYCCNLCDYDIGEQCIFQSQGTTSIQRRCKRLKTSPCGGEGADDGHLGGDDGCGEWGGKGGKGGGGEGGGLAGDNDTGAGGDGGGEEGLKAVLLSRLRSSEWKQLLASDADTETHSFVLIGSGAKGQHARTLLVSLKNLERRKLIIKVAGGRQVKVCVNHSPYAGHAALRRHFGRA